MGGRPPPSWTHPTTGFLELVLVAQVPRPLLARAAGPVRGEEIAAGVLVTVHEPEADDASMGGAVAYREGHCEGLPSS